MAEEYLKCGDFSKSLTYDGYDYIMSNTLLIESFQVV